MILVRWSPSASFFAQKIALLSEQTHETNWILRGKVRVPPPNDELQTPLEVTFLRWMRQSCLLLRRAVVVLENVLRDGHSAKVHDTVRMPPEGYEVIFARRGGGGAIVFVA